MRKIVALLLLAPMIAYAHPEDSWECGSKCPHRVTPSPTPTVTPTVTPSPTATPYVCNEATNCNDYCFSNTEVQTRYCFKGVCTDDALIDCGLTGQDCKDSSPDSYCS